MKRDHGPGELIISEYVVVFCSGKSDTEYESSHNTLDFALSVFDSRVDVLKDKPCSDVRLYIKDKKGYMNCMKTWMHCHDGKIITTNSEPSQAGTERVNNLKP